MSTQELINSTYTDFLQRVNNFIYKKEISKVKIAKEMKISRQTLYNYLNGSKMIPGDRILYFKSLIGEKVYL